MPHKSIYLFFSRGSNPTVEAFASPEDCAKAKGCKVIQLHSGEFSVQSANPGEMLPQGKLIEVQLQKYPRKNLPATLSGVSPVQYRASFLCMSGI